MTESTLESKMLSRHERTLAEMVAETEVEAYIRAQFADGQLAARQFVAGEIQAPRLISYSPVFAAGYMGEIDAHNGEAAETVFTLHSQLTQAMELFKRHHAEADAISDEARKCSMRPEMGHYDAEEYEALLAVVEQYGRWSGDGEYQPEFRLTIDEIARPLIMRPKAPMRSEDARKVVRERVVKTALDRDTTYRVDMRFNPDDGSTILASDSGQPVPASLLAPQLVWAPTPQASKAFLERGEVYWCFWYVPEEVWTDRRGQPRTSWRDEQGVGGIVKTYTEATRADVKRDFRELLRAVMQLRKLSERSADRDEYDPIREVGMDDVDEPAWLSAERVASFVL